MSTNWWDLRPLDRLPRPRRSSPVMPPRSEPETTPDLSSNLLAERSAASAAGPPAGADIAEVAGVQSGMSTECVIPSMSLPLDSYTNFCGQLVQQINANFEHLSGRMTRLEEASEEHSEPVSPRGLWVPLSEIYEARSRRGYKVVGCFPFCLREVVWWERCLAEWLFLLGCLFVR